MYLRNSRIHGARTKEEEGKKKDHCRTIPCDLSRDLNERDSEKFKFDLLVDRFTAAGNSFVRIRDNNVYHFLGTE